MSEKILSEDRSQVSDQWATGMSGRSAGPQPMTLLDILKKDAEFRGKNGQAPELMPYPTESLAEMLSDLYVKATDVQTTIKLVGRNPVMRDREQAEKKLQTILRKAELIKRVINLMGKDIDNFVVDKQSK
tara:strand:+ start:65 stop:454 length:390 start_codon:yes stop_codon:yes gene_type:complete